MNDLSMLPSARVVVSYHPIGDEPDPRKTIAAAYPRARLLMVPLSAKSDPHIIANKIRGAAGTDNAAIFVPGRAFDRVGTRYGRGNGWYDRFLAEVPVAWTRIGVTTRSRFSSRPLPRQAWDQPVDIILIRDDDGCWNVILAKNRRTQRDTHLPADQSLIVPAATIAKKKPRVRL